MRGRATTGSAQSHGVDNGAQRMNNLSFFPAPRPLKPLKTLNPRPFFAQNRPSVEQPVDLYAPKLNGPGGDATVHLRVRCCEPGGKRGTGPRRSVSAPNVMVSLASKDGCVYIYI